MRARFSFSFYVHRCAIVSFFPCILCLGFIFSESKTNVYFAKAQALTICATIVHHHFFLMIIYFFCLHVFFCCCCQQILFRIIFLFRPCFIPVRVVCLNVTRLSVIVIIWNLHSKYFAQSSMCDIKILIFLSNILEKNKAMWLQVNKDYCFFLFHWWEHFLWF